MKNNWLKPISSTSIFEFEVDPYMEWLSGGSILDVSYDPTPIDNAMYR